MANKECLAKCSSLGVGRLQEFVTHGFLQPVENGGLWHRKEVLHGHEHNPSHPIIVAGLLNRAGTLLDGKFKLNTNALITAALYHDLARHTDHDSDNNHGLRAGQIIEKLFQYGELPITQAELSEALRITTNHQLPHRRIRPDDINLRVFIFCDVLSMVRYEGNGNQFELTAETLNSILPNTFSDMELKNLIDLARQWNSQCRQLIDLGVKPVTAALLSGQIKGVFSDSDEEVEYSMHLFQQKAQRKRKRSL